MEGLKVEEGDSSTLDVVMRYIKSRWTDIGKFPREAYRRLTTVFHWSESPEGHAFWEEREERWFDYVAKLNPDEYEL